MKKISTTPFEDLILGSQFVPVLAEANCDSFEQTLKETSKNIGIFQCRKCGSNFLKILDLPLHMEKHHLSFYREVSLVLNKEDAQLNKVYRCGECDSSIQGKVSIVQHLLTHESGTLSGSTSPTRAMELANGAPSLIINGVTTHGFALNGEESGEGKHSRTASPSSLQEQIQVEINPLDLLSTILEEDLRSDNPVLPTQHFLLGHPATTEEPPSHLEDLSSGGEYCGGLAPTDQYSSLQEENADTLHLNGLGTTPVHDQTLYESAAPGVFQCGQCNEAFKYQYLLTAHRKQRHEGAVVTPFRCCVCGNEFTTLSDLKRHSTAVGHPADLSHFCPVCGHAFVAAADLKQHLMDHSKSNRRPQPVLAQVQGKEVAPPPSTIEKTMCDGCSKEFPSKSELTRHIVKYQGTCNPNKSESVQCATCGDEMTTLEELKEHRRLSHPPSPNGDSARAGMKKGFQCDYCGKNFSCRSNLRDHLVVHTGEKPYPCDICGKTFSFIHNMKTHRLTHNEGRNEMCPYCDKAYKSKISLYYHMKKGNCRGLSTKEVPEGFRRCTECLQMFASEERFQTHKTKGTCQMSYRCIHCGIRCSSQDKLEKHLQKGNCTKSSEVCAISAERRKRRAAARRRAEEEPVCCERCNNYNRDCCCTFSCRMCGKRVFSIGAFISHQRLHMHPNSQADGRGLTSSVVPVRLPKKERIIRSVVVERRRRQRKRRGKNRSGRRKAVVATVPVQVSQRESATVEKEEQEPKDKCDMQTEKDAAAAAAASSPNIVPLSRDTLIPPPLTLSLTSSATPTSVAIVDRTVMEHQPLRDDGGGSDDDSNSGSLTDLSPFTAPNLLLTPTPPVASSGEG